MRYFIALLMLTAATFSMRAQPELRIEETGLPPAVGTLLPVGSNVFQWTYRGLYKLDNESKAWRYVGRNTMKLNRNAWTIHPNGLVVVQSDFGTAEFDANTEVVTVNEGIRFDARHSDSLVAKLDVEYLTDTTKRFKLTWLRWPTLDTARVDTQEIKAVVAHHILVPCADGSLLTLASSGVCRFHYDRQPTVIDIAEEITSDRYYIYSDLDRTHIVLTGKERLVHSTNLFESYSYISDVLPRAVGRVLLTANPSLVYVAHGGVVERIDQLGQQRTTIRDGLPAIFRNFAVVNDTVVIGVLDSILLVNNSQTHIANTGLPSRSLTRVSAVSNGLIASGERELLIHSQTDNWSKVSFGNEDYLFKNATSISPVSGNSIDDFLVLIGDAVAHVNPRPFIEKIEYGYPGYLDRGVYTETGKSFFTMLYALEGIPCGTHQVAWVSGNSPIRILLCKDDLHSFMVFNNRDFVALTREGFGWRTVGGDIESWAKVALPVITSNQSMQTSTKGNHAIARVHGFMMWTHDAGQTWNHDIGDVLHSAIAVNGDIYTVRSSDHPDSTLVVEQRANNIKTTLAVYSQDQLPTPSLQINDVAYDDAEQRLYVATQNWTVSMAVLVSSVPVNWMPETGASSLPIGLYDLYGRYIADKKESAPSSGLYLLVNSNGVQRLAVVR